MGTGEDLGRGILGAGRMGINLQVTCPPAGARACRQILRTRAGPRTVSTRLDFLRDNRGTSNVSSRQDRTARHMSVCYAELGCRSLS